MNTQLGSWKWQLRADRCLEIVVWLRAARVWGMLDPHMLHPAFDPSRGGQTRRHCKGKTDHIISSWPQLTWADCLQPACVMVGLSRNMLVWVAHNVPMGWVVAIPSKTSGTKAHGKQPGELQSPPQGGCRTQKCSKLVGRSMSQQRGKACVCDCQLTCAIFLQWPLWAVL